MNTQPLDELYFTWLYSQVAEIDPPESALTFWKLLKAFFTKEAIWVVANDENRLEDGKALRHDFLEEVRPGEISYEWANMPCSFLELLVGLSRRLSFEAEGEPHYWFWKMVENLKLNFYSDDQDFPDEHVDDVLDMVLWRTYKSNGRGGLFPLRRTDKDQRKVELWYQVAEYLQEQNE